ncbi:MAG: hypothetical protein ACI8TA_003644, partial [Cyclobacteriaceae bacterium]
YIIQSVKRNLYRIVSIEKSVRISVENRKIHCPLINVLALEMYGFTLQILTSIIELTPGKIN